MSLAVNFAVIYGILRQQTEFFVSLLIKLLVSLIELWVNFIDDIFGNKCLNLWLNYDKTVESKTWD